MHRYLRGIAHHVVVPCCADHTKIITVYHPDEIWIHDQLIVIKDVLAWVCEQCREAWFSYETFEKIDKVMQEVHVVTVSSPKENQQ